MKIKAVIFDLDGTLRDTCGVIYAAVKHAVKTHSGTEPSNGELAEYMHHHSHVHQRFAPQVSLAEFEKAFHGKLFELLPKVELYRDAAQLLSQLHGQGYKLAIVSSAGTEEIQNFLQAAEVAKYFDGITGDNGVLARKPSPEPVLDAMTQLGVAAVECVMIGDMRVDIQAATAAGIPVKIGITHGFETAQQLKSAEADYIIDSLMDLPQILASIK